MGHHVKDIGKKFGENDTIRYFQTREAIPFHTDGCDAFALFCLSKGVSGGQSTLASSVTAFNKILERRPDLAKVLPIYTYYKDRLSMIHKRPYIDSAQRFDDVPKF